MQPMMNWDSLDWDALERLRNGFLSGAGAAAAYWQTPTDLAAYDLTFAQRIAWKWDAVLAELLQRGWVPPPGEVFDWGCGSGVAGRCVVRAFGQENCSGLRVFDRSSLAMDFAVTRAKSAFPKLAVHAGAPADGRAGLLVLSHVLNELPTGERDALVALAHRADAVLWVEPGTHADSRALAAMRERLRGAFEVIAPCTHNETCGALAPGNERHWCHNFAAPPPGVLTDSDWVRFGQRMGIDLRSGPYSFLVLERKGLRPTSGHYPGWRRVIGSPRVYKGFAKVLCCQADGLADFTLQKRDAPAAYKQFKNEEPLVLMDAELAGEKLVNVAGTVVLGQGSETE